MVAAAGELQLSAESGAKFQGQCVAVAVERNHSGLAPPHHYRRSKALSVAWILTTCGLWRHELYRDERGFTKGDCNHLHFTITQRSDIYNKCNQLFNWFLWTNILAFIKFVFFFKILLITIIYVFEQFYSLREDAFLNVENNFFYIVSDIYRQYANLFLTYSLLTPKLFVW